ncbi:hypothetical protein ACHWQZ_G000190 [Mnemiopsis leidyi]
MMTARFRIIDSFAHLPSSLEKLTRDLKTESTEAFKALTKHVESSWRGEQEKLKMLLRKGVFPYSWLNHATKLEVTSLPSKGSFFITNFLNPHAQRRITDMQGRFGGTLK